MATPLTLKMGVGLAEQKSEVAQHLTNRRVLILRAEQLLDSGVKMKLEVFVRPNQAVAIVQEFRDTKGSVVINFDGSVWIRRKRLGRDFDYLSFMARDFLMHLLGLAPIYGKASVWLALKAACSKYSERRSCFHIIKRNMRRYGWEPESIELILSAFT